MEKLMEYEFEKNACLLVNKITLYKMISIASKIDKITILNRVDDIELFVNNKYIANIDCNNETYMFIHNVKKINVIYFPDHEFLKYITHIYVEV